ncbi:hypothetical protein BCR34DRAFT_276898 [Clohesyomyces aquaticus]|uniref:Uncharacterized protein n=1 Tax=Clohesyomyces aquaticus TaxID=1231657 RepID=A0A1Y1ZT44_9PLEO|nr:hypothetical protein BCR34DRAFT_276898 [Clohesyomyces aquaticus]
MPSSRSDIPLDLLGSSGNFSAWSELYSKLLSRRRIHISHPAQGTVISHEKILQTFAFLKSHVDSTREDILSSLVPGANDEQIRRDWEISLDVAIQAIFMIDAFNTRPTRNRPTNIRPRYWASTVSFLDFIESQFPEPVDPTKGEIAIEDLDALRAWKLEKKLGVSFAATDNLSDHLLYDRRYHTIYLFHHVGFLIAHLSARAKSLPFESSFRPCLEIGTLPPRLLLETLQSLQNILFPSIDPKAHKLMAHLVKKAGFDSECEQYSGVTHKDLQYQTSEIGYKYWGERLDVIHTLFSERPATTSWEKWLRWHGSEANALGIAILALLISIAVGIVSIGLSAIQIWIAWMAWKHPN